MNIRERSASEQERIVEHFRSALTKGEFAIGERLPTETELCETFGASRYTVREALGRLQDLGLIDRRQGSGSVVISTREVHRFTNSISSIPELMQYAEETRLDILFSDTILAFEKDAKLYGVPERSIWRKFYALRHDSDDTLISYSEILVAEEYAGAVGAVGRRREPVFSRLETDYGVRIARVRQTIAASVADLNVANRLMIDQGEPVLVIRRIYEDSDGEVLEVSLNYHPTSRFSYDIVMERS